MELIRDYLTAKSIITTRKENCLWKNYLTSSTFLTFLVQVVKMVAVDFGAESLRFLSARRFLIVILVLLYTRKRRRNYRR